jgi:hypothetical protein
VQPAPSLIERKEFASEVDKQVGRFALGEAKRCRQILQSGRTAGKLHLLINRSAQFPESLFTKLQF